MGRFFISRRGPAPRRRPGGRLHASNVERDAFQQREARGAALDCSPARGPGPAHPPSRAPEARHSRSIGSDAMLRTSRLLSAGCLGLAMAAALAANIGGVEVNPARKALATRAAATPGGRVIVKFRPRDR